MRLSEKEVRNRGSWIVSRISVFYPEIISLWKFSNFYMNKYIKFKTTTFFCYLETLRKVPMCFFDDFCI